MSSLNDHVVFITGGTYGVGRGIARAPDLTLVAAVSLILYAAPARAQAVGVRAGASADPDQFYGGVHFETNELAESQPDAAGEAGAPPARRRSRHRG